MGKHVSKKKTMAIVAITLLILLFLTACTPEAMPDAPTIGIQQTEGIESTSPTEVPTEPPTAAPTEGPSNNATEHVHNWSSVVKEPTCTEKGYTTHSCGCGENYTDGETAAKGHKWDAGVVTKEATEEADGERKHTCTVCSATEYWAIPSKNHVHSYDQVVVTPPTCTEKGYTTHACRCGDSYRDCEVASKGHEWEHPTCMEQNTCKICGDITGSLHDHNFTDATCTTPATCSDCGKVQQGTARGHKWKNATCTTPATCSVCGATEGVANGHSWKDATCTAPKTCTICGATEGSANGHNYNSVVKEPTETERGYTTHTCTICGDWYQDNRTDTVAPTGTAETLVFSADGVARLYDENSQVIETYTGWMTECYTESITPPWGSSIIIKRVVIEDGVAPQYTDYWFYGCKGLLSVTIGNSVTNIGKCAFANCTKLVNLAIGGSVTSIDKFAFLYCDSLYKVIIPDGVISIGDSAFYSCNWLGSVTFGRGVTCIGEEAFCHCPELWTVTFVEGSQLASIKQEAFYLCPLSSIVYGGTMAEWKAVEKGVQWCDNTRVRYARCTDGVVTISPW